MHIHKLFSLEDEHVTYYVRVPPCMEVILGSDILWIRAVVKMCTKAFLSTRTQTGARPGTSCNNYHKLGQVLIMYQALSQCFTNHWIYSFQKPSEGALRWARGPWSLNVGSQLPGIIFAWSLAAALAAGCLFSYHPPTIQLHIHME